MPGLPQLRLGLPRLFVLLLLFVLVLLLLFVLLLVLVLLFMLVLLLLVLDRQRYPTTPADVSRLWLAQ